MKKSPLILFIVIHSLFLLLLFPLLLHKSCLASETKIPKGIDIIYHIRIEGEIDLGLAPFINRVVKEADKQGIKAAIFEINTFGGRLDAAVQIRDALINSNALTIAFINERAISAGALISLACKKIVMAPAATIGAATPVTINPLDQQAKPAGEKIISYFRKEMKATAEKYGRPTLIAEAMVDPDVVVEGLNEKGKLLTLTTSEAIENKLADLEVSGGIQEIISEFGLEPDVLVIKEPNWAEKFLRVISGNLLSSLLLTIGIIGLFLEFKTPTWGVAGTIGLICLILFFWGHWVVKLVGWEEIILIAIGTFLLILEGLVFPGFGLPGILGILTLALAMVLSLVGKNPSVPEIWSAISHVSIVLICVLVCSFILAKSLIKTRAVQNLVLHTHTKSGQEIGYESESSDKTSLAHRGGQRGEKENPYIGMEGIAFTNLRPAGKGIFGKERLNIVTEGDFLEKGAPICIIRVEGGSIIVQKIKGKEMC